MKHNYNPLKPWKFYKCDRLPRKLKKKIKNSLTPLERTIKRSIHEMHWMYLCKTNPDYVKSIISNICKHA